VIARFRVWCSLVAAFLVQEYIYKMCRCFVHVAGLQLRRRLGGFHPPSSYLTSPKVFWIVFESTIFLKPIPILTSNIGINLYASITERLTRTLRVRDCGRSGIQILERPNLLQGNYKCCKNHWRLEGRTKTCSSLFNIKLWIFING